MVAVAKCEIVPHIDNPQIAESTAASRTTRLLQHAQARGITWEADYVHDGALIMREPARRRRCEIVSAEGCSCDYYRFWRFCAHAAVFEAVTG